MRLIRPNDYSPAALAYLGDCVVELLVREMLLTEFGDLPSDVLFKKALAYVKADAQAAAAEKLAPILSEEETEVYKRGRNSKGRTPKHASMVDYRRATGLETLFGWLHLSKKSERINELFKCGFADVKIIEDCQTLKTE